MLMIKANKTIGKRKDVRLLKTNFGNIWKISLKKSLFNVVKKDQPAGFNWVGYARGNICSFYFGLTKVQNESAYWKLYIDLFFERHVQFQT